MFYRKRKIKNVVLDVRSEAHFEAFLVKQGVLFLTVSNVSGVWSAEACISRSPYSTIENNNNLNSLISEFSKLNGHLLTLGDFNYPTINWTPLDTPDNKN